MRKPGWDARRRNKNIGTAKSGRGQNNQMRIPEYWMGGNYILYYEKLEHPVILSRTVGDRDLTFLDATEFWERQKMLDCIPFKRILNEEKLIAEGLSLSWFMQHENTVTNE